MSKVDWSLAPEWATHALVKMHNPGVGGVHWSYFIDGEHRISPDGLWFHPDGYRVADERPRNLKPKPWSGPEDGLPPEEWCSVGKMVQVMSLPTHHHEDVSIYLSKPSKIVASYTGYDGDTFLMLRIDCDFGTGYECFAAHRVLPAKTENQLAADTRETAIRELMDIAQVDCRVTATRLVDAGFKREVV